MTYTLDGLNCPVCAAKIEESVAKLPQFKEVSINFTTQTLKVANKEASSEADDGMTEQTIQDVVSRIEPGVKVKSSQKPTGEHNEHSFKGKTLLFRLAFSFVFFVLGFLSVIPEWLSMGLLLTGYLLSGYDVLYKAFRNIIRGNIFDEFFLMSIATIGAVILGEYHEALGVMIFYQTGEFLQETAVKRSRNAVSALLSIVPDKVRVRQSDGTVIIAEPENIEIGAEIVVYPGERVAIDGTVVEGAADVDFSAITGESVPVGVSEGSEVQSGAISLDGILTIKTGTEYSNSTVKRIMDLVEHAQERKSETERFITRFARIYTPVVVGIAVLLAVIPPLLFEGAVFSDWIYRSLTFLVISCPCALVLSIPLGYFAGIGAASRLGILFKGGTNIDVLAKVKSVVFDKTGTLTNGEHVIKEVRTAKGVSREAALRIAAALEQQSNHPLAKAVLQEAEIISQEVKDLAVNAQQTNGEFNLSFEQFREESGGGIYAESSGKKYIIGSQAFLKKNGINVPADIQNSKGTAVHLGVNDGWYASFFSKDRLRTEGPEVIRALKSLGIRNTGLYSGDRQAAVQDTGEQLGIDDIRWELLPEEKLDLIEGGSFGPVAFVGDGINDAPGLARADVGIAIGGIGSDAAVEAADVVLVNDDLRNIPRAIRIASFARQIIIQNISGVFFIKLLLLALGAAGYSSMWMALIGDVGVSLLAVLNSMRILSHFK